MAGGGGDKRTFPQPYDGKDAKNICLDNTQLYGNGYMSMSMYRKTYYTQTNIQTNRPTDKVEYE